MSASLISAYDIDIIKRETKLPIDKCERICYNHVVEYEGIAQLVEHLLDVQGVIGSSPIIFTNKNRPLKGLFLLVNVIV